MHALKEEGKTGMGYMDRLIKIRKRREGREKERELGTKLTNMKHSAKALVSWQLSKYIRASQRMIYSMQS